MYNLESGKAQDVGLLDSSERSDRGMGLKMKEWLKIRVNSPEVPSTPSR